MINREFAGASAVTTNSNNLLSEIGELNYIFYEIYYIREWLGFVDFIKIHCFQSATLFSDTLT